MVDILYVAASKRARHGAQSESSCLSTGGLWISCMEENISAAPGQSGDEVNPVAMFTLMQIIGIK